MVCSSQRHEQAIDQDLVLPSILILSSLDTTCVILITRTLSSPCRSTAPPSVSDWHFQVRPFPPPTA